MNFHPENRHDATADFASALDELERRGGGTLIVPPGDYRSGPIRLRSHTTLHLEAGARIRFFNDPARFNVVKTRWAGFVCHAYMPCVWADECEDVSLTGGGILDGQGETWWAEYWKIYHSKRNAPALPSEKAIVEANRSVALGGNVWDEWKAGFLRPPLVQFHRCRRVKVEDVTLTNSPFWTCHIVFCDDVRIRGIQITGPQDHAAPNRDGIDIDSSSRVTLSDCLVESGDDGIVLKAGIGRDGRDAGKATEDVVINNCIIPCGHAGVVFGSETAGWIRRVAISNCVFRNTYWGLRFKSRRGRGGGVEDVRATNLVMDCVRCPITLNLFYTAGSTEESRKVEAAPQALPVNELTPSFRRIHVSGLSATNVSAAAGVFIGLPESPLRDISLRDFAISCDTAAVKPEIPAMSFKIGPQLRQGFHIEDVERFVLRDGKFEYESGNPFVRIRDEETQLGSVTAICLPHPASAKSSHRYVLADPPADGRSNRAIALVLIDFLEDFFDPKLWPGSELPAARATLVRSANEAVGLFRAAGGPVVWVRQAFSPDMSDAPIYARRRGFAYAVRGTFGSQILGDLAWDATDVHIEKPALSAFFRTNLHDQLLARNVGTLVLCGITTPWCVRSTAVDACQYGYRVLLLQEAIGAFHPDEHGRAMSEMLEFFADAIDLQQLKTMMAL